MKRLLKNGHSEPIGERTCIEAAMMLERIAKKGYSPLYSGLIEELRLLSEEIRLFAEKEAQK